MNTEIIEIDWMPVASSLLLTLVYLWLVINHAEQGEAEKTRQKEDEKWLVLDHFV